MSCVTRRLPAAVAAFALMLPASPLWAAEAASVELEELEVSAPRVRSPSTLEQPASNVYLPVQELMDVAGNQGDPLSAVGSLPGVATPTSGGGGPGGSGFFVRGSDRNENRVWVDGLPLGYLYHLGGLTSVLNPDTVRSFETYLAGFPVEYGDYLGGVVDVSLRDPRGDRLRQTYQVGVYESSAMLEGPVGEKGAGYVAARRSYIDLFLPPSGTLPGSDTRYTVFPQFYDAQARYRRPTAKGFFDLNVYTASDTSRLILDDEAVTSDPAAEGALGTDQAFTTVGGRWVHELSPAWLQTVRLGVLEETTELQIGTQLEGDPDPGAPFTLDIRSQEAFFHPKWERFGRDTTWTAGVDVSRTALDLGGYIIQQPSERDVAVDFTSGERFDVDATGAFREAAPYGRVEHWLSPNVSAHLGLRYTWFAGPDGTALAGVSPRSGLRWDVTADTALTARWGLFRQTPNGNELLADSGNPALGWEVAEHRVVGVKHRLNRAWSAQVEAYHKPMRDMVVDVADERRFANAGTGEAYGVDVLLKRARVDDTFGWLGYSWGRSFRTDDRTGDTRRFSGDQPHTVQAVWSQPYGEGSPWRWGLRVLAHSGQPYTPVVGRYQEPLPGAAEGTDCGANPDDCRWRPEYGEQNSERLPFFVRLDLRTERTFERAWGEWALVFELVNAAALLRPNVASYEYRDDYADFRDPEEVEASPFMPSFSIRARL